MTTYSIVYDPGTVYVHRSMEYTVEFNATQKNKTAYITSDTIEPMPVDCIDIDIHISKLCYMNQGAACEILPEGQSSRCFNKDVSITSTDQDTIIAELNLLWTVFANINTCNKTMKTTFMNSIRSELANKPLSQLPLNEIKFVWKGLYVDNASVSSVLLKEITPQSGGSSKKYIIYKGHRYLFRKNGRKGYIKYKGTCVYLSMIRGQYISI